MSKVDLAKSKTIESKLKGDAFGLFLANTAYKELFPYMPYYTGNYAKLIDFEPFKYIHRVTYAEYVYNINKDFRKDIHPLATAKYAEVAEPTVKPKIIAQATSYIDTVIL